MNLKTETSAPHPRRAFIKLLGGGAVVAATAPLLSGCAGGIPDEAVAAWRDQPARADVRRFMLAHALLAPNPHNRQPWIADLSTPNEIRLICDGEKLLPETDPFGRQILVGCGAFVELAVIAARELGQNVEVTLFPAGAPSAAALPKGTLVAQLKLSGANAQPDPLFGVIRKRHTHKGLYDNAKMLTQAQWDALHAPAKAFGLRSASVADGLLRNEVKGITRQAWEIEMTGKETWQETARLLRVGKSEILANRDGIAMASGVPVILNAIGQFDRMAVPVRGNTTYSQVMKRWAAFETGAGYFWLATEGNARNAQVNAGRAYVRTHLTATSLGIEMQPLSQALQEFPAMAQQYKAIHQALGLKPETHTLQMLCRVGFAEAPANPTPRRELASFIRG